MALILGPVAAAAQESGSVHPVEDTVIFNMIKIEADYAPRNDDLITWDVDGWIGGDFERVWLRSEGEAVDGDLEEAEAQLYYGWNVATFWDALVGLRQDFEPERETYLAASLVGLAPYFFETEGSLFVSTDGDVSLRVKQNFDLLITQQLIVEPHIEANLYAQDVPERNAGAGLSDVEASLQLRYEIVRKISPYVEVAWARKFGETSSRAQAAGDNPEATTVRLGLRLWF
jgi:copper resistance protein B